MCVYHTRTIYNKSHGRKFHADNFARVRCDVNFDKSRTINSVLFLYLCRNLASKGGTEVQCVFIVK
jgi:hypothetical protein